LGDRSVIDIGQDTDFDGAGHFIFNAANTFSLANELKARDTNSSSPAEFTLAYDTCGNQTDDGTAWSFKPLTQCPRKQGRGRRAASPHKVGQVILCGTLNKKPGLVARVDHA